MTHAIPQKLQSLYIPLGLFVVNFVLKIIYLDFGVISGDEPFTIFYAQQDLSEMMGMFQNENNPPIHFLLLHFWIKAFGISAYSVRFPSLVFSAATVVVLYQLARKFFNFQTAIVASIIFTFSNYHIFFAHEARVYPLFALLTAISMYGFFSLLQHPQNKKHLALLIVTNTLLIYSHFFGFFVIALQGFAVIFHSEIRSKLLKPFSIATAITGLTYLPYLPIFLHRFDTSSGGTWVSPTTFESLYINLWNFSNEPVNTVLFIVILVTAAVLALLGKKRIQNYPSTHSFIAIVWFLVPFLTIFILSFKIPMFLDRYLIFISLGYYLTLGVAINYLSDFKWVKYPVIAISLGLMIFTVNPKNGHDQSLKIMVDTVVTKKGNSTLYICPDWINLGFTYHYNLEYFQDYKNINALLEKDGIYPITHAGEIGDLEDRVIYLDGWSELVDPEGLIRQKLQNEHPVVNLDDSYRGFKIYEFSK